MSANVNGERKNAFSGLEERKGNEDSAAVELAVIPIGP
jgi:hypothetical protein